MKRLSSLTLVAALALGASGCEEEEAAPAAVTPPPAKAKAAKPAAAPAAPAPAPAYVYAYNPTGKRDPFRAPQVQRVDVVNDVCSEPLCQFDLDQLTLVAVVTGGPNPVAMVEDPQGRGFVVRRNARVGRRGGKVSAIRRDEITVTEFWSGPDGKVVPSAVVLKLSPDEERSKELNFATGQPL